MAPSAPDIVAEGTARALVGRQREVSEIAASLDEALAGRGRLLLVAGEPGIGKTRLADEVSAAAAARQALVLWGRCWEAGGAPAYWPWLEVLSGLVRAVDDAGLREALGEGAALVGEVVPEVRARLGELPIVTPPSPAEARFRLWRAVGGLVRRAAAPAGLLVVIDDLHAADEPSLLLLHFVARELRSVRALFLATYRDVEARLEPAAGELLARIGREGTTVSLGRLDREASARLLHLRAGAVEPAVEAKIFASTQGNPLFLEEMVRLLGEQGPESIAAGAVPEGVREAIARRLDRVPPDARPLLDLAAVAGDEIDVALIAAAAGREPSVVSHTLAGAVRAGVLADRGGRRLRFFHALVREVLYRDIDERRRARLHGDVADALTKLSAGSASLPLTELAHHHLEGPPENIGRAVDFAVRAAERALELVAYEEAVALLSRAAAAVEEAGNRAPERARVLLALGEARIRRGESGPGKAHCLEVAALARELGDAELLARAAVAYGQVFTLAVVDPTLVSLLEEALAALPPGASPLRVRLMARLGAALQPAQFTDEPVKVAREAIRLARELNDRKSLLDALYAALSAMMDVTDPLERLPLNLEAEQLAIMLGDRERLLRTHARIAVDHFALGDFAAVDQRVAAFEALAIELRAPWYLWRAPFFRAMRAMVHGRFEDAERFAQEGLRIGLQAQDHEIQRCYTLQREGLLRAWERHDEMIAFDPAVRRAKAQMSSGTAWQAAGTALLHARCEDEEKARLYLDLIPADRRPHSNNVYAIFSVVDPLALVGELDYVARIYDMLPDVPDRDVSMGMSGMMWEGPVARLRALLAGRLGRSEAAAAHFEEAIARLEKQDAGPYLARTRYEYARALLTRVRPDAERARSLLGAARQGAERLGLQGLVPLIDKRLASVGAGRLEAGAAAETFSLSAEGEYWSLAYGGQTFRLKDSLGVRYLARLIEEPGREVHVLELVGSRPAEGEVVDAGDAGELLDDDARDTYRRRLEDLRESLAEAESFGDAGRAAKMREEIEFLGAELGRAVGLGGRSRRAGGAAERARSAVQRRIKNALERIEEHAPALAAYLGRGLKTGSFCVFQPPARDGTP